MKLSYSICLFTLFLSCKNESEDKVREPIILQIDHVYRTGGSMTEGNRHVDMADHYLILKEYSEEDASSWSNFVQFADNYRDTVQTTLPLSSITIVKPYKKHVTSDLYGGEGWLELREHCLLTINYSKQTMHDKLADISSLDIWQNGEPFNIDLMTDKRIKKLDGYFDSSGEFSEKWSDRYKNQIPVDREADSILRMAEHSTNNR